MKVLKKDLANVLIYVPFENRNIIGKFIDPRLYPYMAEKYPDLFEDEEDVVEVKSKKNSKKDDLYINDSEQYGNNNNITEQNFFSE